MLLCLSACEQPHTKCHISLEGGSDTSSSSYLYFVRRQHLRGHAIATTVPWSIGNLGLPSDTRLDTAIADHDVSNVLVLSNDHNAFVRAYWLSCLWQPESSLLITSAYCKGRTFKSEDVLWALVLASLVVGISWRPSWKVWLEVRLELRAQRIRKTHRTSAPRFLRLSSNWPTQSKSAFCSHVEVVE